MVSTDATSLDDMWRSFVTVLSGQVTHDDPARDFLRVARLLAGRFDVGLTMLVPLMDPQATVSYMGEGASTGVISSLIDAANEENKARRAAAEALFDDMFAGLDDVTMQIAAGREADLAARAARAADMLICQAPSCFADDAVRAGGQDGLIETILFESGHPVLAIPLGGLRSGDGAFTHPLIAWNDTAEVARAVSAAMPLLRKARTVSLAHAQDVDPDPAVKWLQRHGVDVSVVNTPVTDTGLIEDKTGDAILAVAEKAGADVIVMGAFVHSRLRQLIMGGATRTVLKRSKVPVLLAH